MKSIQTVYVPDTGFMQKVSELEKILQLEPYTYKHSLNVANYSVRFIKSLRLSADEEKIFYSGLFHDIGKTKISKAILHKVTPLTEKEFDVVKSHVVIGARILSDFELTEDIISSALYHHERFGGRGYPYGINGLDIPFLARVTSICDVFDALTMNRPYRKAFSVDAAIDIMVNSPGQFDNDLLSAFFTFLEAERIQYDVYENLCSYI